MIRLVCLAIVLCFCASFGTSPLGGRPIVFASPELRPRPLPRLPINIYAGTLPGKFSPTVMKITPRVYVPNSGAGTVDVIDPTTFQIVGHFPVGVEPHHVTPSWDLTRLYVNNTESNTLTEINPSTGLPVATIRVRDPYNLYFTVDGRKAIVVAERYRRLDFRDPHSWKLIKSVPIPWPGVDHLDFSADGRYLLATTEYSGMVVKVDTETMSFVGYMRVGGLPIDVRLAPDGTVFFVANQGRHGVSIVDPEAMQEVEFIPTGKGAHGLQVSRDTKWLYVSNRLSGTISVISLQTRTLKTTWVVGGSPDMMQVSPNGDQLWVANRYSNSVTVIDTENGQILAVIPVGANPHGLDYFPQPGRFSIGHNGVFR